MHVIVDGILNTLPVPSQASIYQHMLAVDNTIGTTQILHGQAALFLNEGLRLQDNQ